MERRQDERISINAKGSFFVRSASEYYGEFQATIVDISERGVRIKAGSKCKDIIQQISEDATLSFQAMEEYELFSEKEMQIFYGKLEIVHQFLDDGDIVLGCSMETTNPEIKEYIKKRKMSYYMKSIDTSE